MISREAIHIPSDPILLREVALALTFFFVMFLLMIVDAAGFNWGSC